MPKFFEKKGPLIRAIQTNSDAGFYSLVFFIVTILAARLFTFEELGVYSVLYSSYLLLQGLYFGVFGEFILIKNINEIRKNQGFVSISLLFLLIFFCLFQSPLLLLLNLSGVDIFIYFFSVFALIFMNNARYCFHGMGCHSGALYISISFLILTSSSFFLLEMLMRIELFKNLEAGVRLFLYFGVSAIVIDLFCYFNLKIDWDLRVWKEKFIEHKTFIGKSSLLSASFWITGNLHWVILGTFFNAAFLGVIRGCLSLVNPLQVLDRGLTLSLLSSIGRDFSVRSALVRHTIFAQLIYFFVIIFWLIFSEQIILLTVGEKFIDYEHVISILIFTPLFQICFSLISATLKTKEIFAPQIVIQSLLPVLMMVFVIFSLRDENVVLLAIGILSISVFSAFSLLLWVVIVGNFGRGTNS